MLVCALTFKLMPGCFSRNGHFGDEVAPVRRNADVGPSHVAVMIFICSGVKLACGHVGLAGHFHRSEIHRDRQGKRKE